MVWNFIVLGKSLTPSTHHFITSSHINQPGLKRKGRQSHTRRGWWQTARKKWPQMPAIPVHMSLYNMTSRLFPSRSGLYFSTCEARLSHVFCFGQLGISKYYKSMKRASTLRFAFLLLLGTPKSAWEVVWTNFPEGETSAIPDVVPDMWMRPSWTIVPHSSWPRRKESPS